MSNHNIKLEKRVNYGENTYDVTIYATPSEARSTVENITTTIKSFNGIPLHFSL